MARARLRDRHQDNLHKKLQMLKAQQGMPEEQDTSAAGPSRIKQETSPDHADDNSQPAGEDKEETQAQR
jgi:hypothetical protein